MVVSTGSPAFEWVCKELAAKGVMSQLEARGTVRLAVKEAGLNPSTITKVPMLIVLSRLLRKQLEIRSVRDAAKIAEGLSAGLERALLNEARGPETPEDIFARLGPNRGRGPT